MKTRRYVSDVTYQDCNAANPCVHYFEIVHGFSRVDGIWREFWDATEVDVRLGFRGNVQSKSALRLDGAIKALALAKQDRDAQRSLRRRRAVDEDLQSHEDFRRWTKGEQGKQHRAEVAAIVLALNAEVRFSLRGNPTLLVPEENRSSQLLRQLVIRQHGNFDFTCVKSLSPSA